MADPIGELVHDHASLNRQVFELRHVIDGRSDAPVADVLTVLREDLFRHFAREEEALFPFASEQLPELAPRIETMLSAHDAICGVVARMCYLAEAGVDDGLLPLYERLASTYGAHAQMEAEVLALLHARLDPDARHALAQLVRDL